jgi:hypothetical protein
MDTFKVGDLVRDKLNEGATSYGLGVIVKVDVPRGISITDGRIDRVIGPGLAGKRYNVYFNKFERTIAFHGDYLEKV